MFKEQMNKIKSLMVKNNVEDKEKKSDKKKIENLAFFLVLLIVTLITINVILKDDDTEKENVDSQYKELAKEETSVNNRLSHDELEEKIEHILGTMSGVGKVNVLVTYSQTSEVVAMYNEDNSTTHTSETDSEGGTREANEENIKREVIFTNENRLKCSSNSNYNKSEDRRSYCYSRGSK